MSRTFELFHRIDDRPSAQVRRLVISAGLGDAVRFRNVGTSAEALGAMRELTGQEAVPALVVFAEGLREQVLVGEESIRAFVKELPK